MGWRNEPHADLAGASKLKVGLIVARLLRDGCARKSRTVNADKAAAWCVGSKAPEVSDSSPHTGEEGYLVLPRKANEGHRKYGKGLSGCDDPLIPVSRSKLSKQEIKHEIVRKARHALKRAAVAT
jgi:hypothetical protein